MIYLLFSILASTCIFIIFKQIAKLNSNLPTTIVVNYFVAFLIGSIAFNLDFYSISRLEWLVAATLGLLFITLFNVMGLTTQHHGVMLTSISNKMSLIFPATAGFLLHGDQADSIHFIGIGLGIVSIILINFPKKSASSTKLYLPIVLFIGSGFLDALLDYASRHIIQIHSGAFSALIFVFAGVFGLSHLLITKQFQVQKNALLGGLILGTVNFFSIFLVFMSLKHVAFPRAIVFPINNTGIVLASALIGVLAYKEQTNLLQRLGLVGSVLSLILLAWNI